MKAVGLSLRAKMKARQVCMAWAWGWGPPTALCTCCLTGRGSGDLPVATQLLVCSVQASWNVRECDVIDLPKFHQDH